MMNDKPITVEDYKEHAGEGAKAEDILKIMESLAVVIIKKRSEQKQTSIGFNKETEDG